jgi:hypothetical protein
MLLFAIVLAFLAIRSGEGQLSFCNSRLYSGPTGLPCRDRGVRAFLLLFNKIIVGELTFGNVAAAVTISKAFLAPSNDTHDCAHCMITLYALAVLSLSITHPLAVNALSAHPERW